MRSEFKYFLPLFEKILGKTVKKKDFRQDYEWKEEKPRQKKDKPKKKSEKLIL